MIASYRKELYSFAVTPYGMVFAGSFLMLSGLTTALSNLFSLDSHFEAGTLAILPWFLLLLLPLLTMRSLADEQAALPLLYTSVTELWEIVLGKYLAVLSLVCGVCAVTILYPVVYDYYGYVNWSNIMSGYLGLILLIGLYSSIGTWVSSVSSSQAGAAVLTVLIFLVLLLGGQLLPRLPQGSRSQVAILAVPAILALLTAYRNGLRPLYLLLLFSVLLLLFGGLAIAPPRFLQGFVGRTGAFISPLNHYATFTRGLIRIADIVYFLSGSVFFLLLSVLQMEKRRWL
ncbi:hypothetical protein P0082_10300 [Candidatus Haliotispira prima]|uniref:ABC transporter permease n=1 Tax=Candidatus Haliotispira prima TaxID=3034016 RepID=A0ABY8MFT6_9SPIO|nr:hypothetical protein P0082_10300 [Candidatus Haliotispira prima]